MAGMTADAVYVLLGNEIVLLTEKIEQMGGWEPLEHKGTVQTAEDLPTDAKKGWMYNIATDSIYGAAGMNVVMTSEGWDSMGPIINMALYLTKEEAGKSYQPKGNYLSGTDSTLTEPGKAADAKETGDKFSKTSADLEGKLDKNQGSENSGKIAGINESGDIVPMFPVGVEYNEETNCLEFGSDQGMKLNQGIGLDSTLTKTGFAADAGVTGKEINSLKESISTKITKFYASSQGETHLADSDNGKIQDMMVYGKSEQKQYSGKNLLNATLQTTTQNGVTCTNNGDGTYTLNGTATVIVAFDIAQDVFCSSFRLIGCPVGGIHDTSYELQARTNNLIYGYDTGDGKNIKADEKFFIRIRINAGTVCNNLLFKPMITTDLTATYDDFEPYVGGIPSPNPSYPQGILSVKNPVVKVCGKNLLKSTYPTTTKNGVTCTNNNDGTFSLNGTATANCVFIILGQDALKNAFGVNEKLRLTGAPKGSSRSGYYLQIWKDTPEVIYYDIGEGVASEKPNARCNVAIMVTNGTVCNNVLFKPMLTVDLTATYDDFEPYHEQTVTLPYDLYGVKVTSGGNVAIDGQQYVSDYFDVERGKLVRCVKEKSDTISITVAGTVGGLGYYDYDIPFTKNVICNITNIIYEDINQGWASKQACISGSNTGKLRVYLPIGNHDVKIIYELETPEEIDLTTEEIAALKALATYYPTTNISVNSEQLDGYTVFNYPISMQNGWNYVKQQIGDTRDYIYDMDARTQDTDLQAAEAYVNSEYAVALTELEV